jgi:hypothetical protein
MKNTKLQKIFLFSIIFLSGFFVSSQIVFSAWTPIVGIPEPPFGINEVAPSLPTEWTSDTAGFYFVQTGGTNSGNGYPGSPRGSMPSSPPPGSVICLNGTISQAPTIGYNGTAESPIFIRSYNNDARAIITAKWIFYNAAYVIFEDINAEWIGNGKIEVYTTHHLSIRNNNLEGDSIATGGIILQGAYLTGFNQQHHIIINNNVISEAGNWQVDEDQDAHGVTSDALYIEEVWITNNTFFHMSGDAVQIGKIAYNPVNSTRRYYVGANVAYETKQVAFWTKGAGDVIFSSNIAHDLRDDNPSGASAGLGLQVGPEYVWFINNIVYSCIGGIVTGARSGGVGENTYVLGNLFYNIHDTGNKRTDWNNPEQPDGACFMNRGTPNLYFYNNTCDDYDSGFQLGINSVTALSKLSNNILTSRNTAKSGHSLLAYEGSKTLLELKNNIIQGATARIGNSIYPTILALETAIGANATNNIDDSPDYVNATGNDFRLQIGSPAINTGIEIPSEVYATFQERYGLDISKDINGVNRPQGSAWDIGAFEYSESTLPDTTAPSSPTNLSVL